MSWNRARARWLVLGFAAGIVAVGAALAACSSSSSNPAAPSGDGGPEASVASDASDAGAAPGDGQAPADTRVLTWQVQESPSVYGVGDASLSLPDGGRTDLPPVTGAQVCAYLWADGGTTIPGPDAGTAGNIGCTTTDAQGDFSLNLPPATDVVLTVTKAGYNPVLQPIGTSHNAMDGVAQAGPIYLALTTDPQPPIGTTIDWAGTGQVNFFAIGPAPDGGNGFGGDPGAQVSLSPAAGDGPFYIASGGEFQLDASAMVDALGWFYNVPPGIYDLVVADAAHDCEPIEFQFSSNGFPLTTPPHAIQIPVVAGYTTLEVGLFCTAKPPIVNTDGGSTDGGSTDASSAGD
jgi:hypothetical protein